MRNGVMVVLDRRLGWLGQPPGESHVHVRVLDRAGSPIPDVQVFGTRPDEVAAEARVRTNGDGWAILVFRLPAGSPVDLAVELPEGLARRRAATHLHASGQVAVFQSVNRIGRPSVTFAEGISFGAGILLTAVGLSLKGRAGDVLIGLGSGFAATSGFSLVFRHLR